jgi:hypothetical protein
MLSHLTVPVDERVPRPAPIEQNPSSKYLLRSLDVTISMCEVPKTTIAPLSTLSFFISLNEPSPFAIWLGE